MASSAGAAAAAAAVLCVLLVLSTSGRPAAAGLAVPALGPIGQVGGGCVLNCAEVAKTCSSLCQGLLATSSDLPVSKQCESLCGLQAAPVNQERCDLCNRSACVPDCIEKKCTCDDNSSHASAPALNP